MLKITKSSLKSNFAINTEWNVALWIWSWNKSEVKQQLVQKSVDKAFYWEVDYEKLWVIGIAGKLSINMSF